MYISELSADVRSKTVYEIIYICTYPMAIIIYTCPLIQWYMLESMGIGLSAVAGAQQIAGRLHGSLPFFFLCKMTKLHHP